MIKAQHRDKHLISIFTPTYNTKIEYLKKTLASIQKQLFDNWEWVIFDDSENAPEIEKFFKGYSPKIRYFKSSDHSGKIGETKFNATSLCRGQYLVELDHDDVLHPMALTWIYTAFLTEKADFVYSNFAEPYHDSNGFKFYPDGWGMGFGAHHWEYDKWLQKWLLVADAPEINAMSMSNIVGVPNHVRAWNKAFYDKIGGHNFNLVVADDYELLVRTILYDAIIVKIPMVCYLQYTHSKDKTTSQTKNAEIQKSWQTTHNFYKRQLEKYFIGAREPLHSFPAGSYYEYSKKIYSNNILYKTYDEPTIGIVIPTYNRADKLKRALASIAKQTYDSYEIYIIGDHCPTLEKTMQEYKDNARIKWWNLEKNYNDGGATPRNYALKMLFRNRIVAYLDDDNTWDYDHLQQGIIALDNGGHFSFSGFRSEGIEVKCTEPKRYRIDTSALMHKIDLLTFGYWKTRATVGYAHDWELVSRWLAQSNFQVTWAPTNKITVNFDNSTSKQDMAGIRDFYNDQN